MPPDIFVDRCENPGTKKRKVAELGQEDNEADSVKRCKANNELEDDIIFLGEEKTGKELAIWVNYNTAMLCSYEVIYP